MPRIAVLRALQLGDLLVAVPALRALRERFPDAEVTLIGLPWAAELTARYPRYIDRFAEFPGWPGMIERPFDGLRARRFLREQRAYGYDLAIQMHGSGRSSDLFVKALGAKATLGWHEPGQPRGLTVEREYPRDLHEIDRNLALVALIGASAGRRDLEWPTTASERARARALLAGAPRPWIGIHAGARDRRRRWPPSRFATLAAAIAAGGTSVLTGSPREARLTRAIATHVPRPLDLAGRTSLGVLAAVLSELDLLVTNDTGVSQLAVATRTPSVVLWGDADLHRWAPLDRTRHLVLRSDAGVRGITVAEAVGAARMLLGERAAA
ncbi:MAG TPA: glycosyltransferase family 9 protein [Candidatus Limnocylindria bacterium]